MSKKLKAVQKGIEELKQLKWLFYIFGQKKRYKSILLLLIEYKMWIDPDTYEMELFKLVEKYQ